MPADAGLFPTALVVSSGRLGFELSARLFSSWLILAGVFFMAGRHGGDLGAGWEGVDGLLWAHGLAEDVDAFTGQPWDGEQRANRQRHHEESRQVATSIAFSEREDETNTVQVAGLSTEGDCSAGILCPLRLSWRSFPVKSSPFGPPRKDSRAHPGGANIDFDGGLREFIQGYQEKPAGERPESFEIGRVR